MRNDVYQLLVQLTSDFGKETRAQLDWTDIDQIREMVRLRIANALDDDEITFTAGWRHICISHIAAQDSFEYLVERSFFRPRNVLRLINYARSAAINGRREVIIEGDLEKGVEAFSQGVVIEADRELTDVMPEGARLIYQFLGERSLLSRGELGDILGRGLATGALVDRALERLLYFGFIGLEREGQMKFIWNVGYNMEVLLTEIEKFGASTQFYINPAFWPALYIQDVRR